MVNGFGLSETQYGGYSRYARVKPEWLVRLPSAFSPEQAMAIGTRGTRLRCASMRWWTSASRKDAGEVLVTGAAGGVGSVAVALLAAAGFDVVASTGRPETHDYLKALGARSFIDRASLQEKGRAIAEGALGGRCRRGGRHDPRQRAGADEVRKGRCRLRSRRERGSARDGAAAHLAQRGAAGRRFGDGADREARKARGSGLRAICPAKKLADMTRGRADVEAGRARGRDSRRSGARSHGDRRETLIR